MIILQKLCLDANACVELPSVIDYDRKWAYKLVCKCIDRDTCPILKDYFTTLQHGERMRNNDCVLRLPNIKTEFCRKSFFIMGAEVYYQVPTVLGRSEKYGVFEKLLDEYFY